MLRFVTIRNHASRVSDTRHQEYLILFIKGHCYPSSRVTVTLHHGSQWLVVMGHSDPWRALLANARIAYIFLNTKTFVLYYSKLLFAIPCIVLKMKKSCLRTDIYCHNHYLSAFLFHYFHLKWFFQYIFWKKIIAFIFLLVYFESWDCRTFLSCLHYNCRQVILWIIFWQLVKTLKFLCGCNQNKSIIF